MYVHMCVRRDAHTQHTHRTSKEERKRQKEQTEETDKRDRQKKTEESEGKAREKEEKGRVEAVLVCRTDHAWSVHVLLPWRRGHLPKVQATRSPA